MAKLIVQPCGDSEAKSNFVNTIEKKVSKEHVLSFLNEIQKNKLQTFPDAMVPIWGVTSGNNNINKNKWDTILNGDIVLLYKENMFFQKAEIFQKFISNELATDLWGKKKDGSTWECIYILNNLEKINFRIEDYNSLLGYKKKFKVFGFNVHTKEQSKILLENFNIFSEQGILNEVDTDEDNQTFERLVLNFTSSERNTLTYIRKEQATLRKLLINKRENVECYLCGGVFPKNSVSCAHIKPRKACTDDEKCDPYVVMLACRFGCDELYERKIIKVTDNGVIQLNKDINVTPGIIKITKDLINKKCFKFENKSLEYFRWHRNN